MTLTAERPTAAPIKGRKTVGDLSPKNPLKPILEAGSGLTFHDFGKIKPEMSVGSAAARAVVPVAIGLLGAVFGLQTPAF